MSKKSVVISLPPRVSEGGPGRKRGADAWITAAGPEAPPTSSAEASTLSGMIDLNADRSPLELAWMIWTFPALATLHWMARAMGQPRPR